MGLVGALGAKRPDNSGGNLSLVGETHMPNDLTMVSFPLLPYCVHSDGVHVNRRPSYFVTEEGNGPQGYKPMRW